MTVSLMLYRRVLPRRAASGGGAGGRSRCRCCYSPAPPSPFSRRFNRDAERGGVSAF